MLKEMLLRIGMPFFKLKWRLTNAVRCESGSTVYPSCRFEGKNRICRGAYLSRTSLGYGTYVGAGSSIISAQIGRFTCIGPCVRTTSGTHPVDRFVSMHPAFYSLRRQAGFTYAKTQMFDENAEKGYHTAIGHDVWIGDSALLIQGVRIGNGAIIAAGSVVTKDVPDYAVVAGVPAKVIRYRFDERQIAKLLETEWWNREISWIEEHSERFADINRFLEDI